MSIAKSLVIDYLNSSHCIKIINKSLKKKIFKILNKGNILDLPIINATKNMRQG